MYLMSKLGIANLFKVTTTAFIRLSATMTIIHLGMSTTTTRLALPTVPIRLRVGAHSTMAGVKLPQRAAGFLVKELEFFAKALEKARSLLPRHSRRCQVH
ncbi:hypothetical protein GYMLUDRAFT_337751 [Collybiopsis luxurians FD-317 M1]|nr:hypothetical protein GYMLUDRAFT_337751 [Collybiopsis luxurians FD-317 M1]